MQTSNPFEVIINKLEQMQVTLDIISVNNPKQKQPEPPADPNRIVDLPEAAKILRKPVGTLRGYIHSRNLPATLVGKSYLIKYSELMQWFEDFQNDSLHEPKTTAPAKMLENRKRYRKE